MNIPRYDTSGVQVHLGDCRDVLRQLPERSVQTVVTSPPYFGLRDYGTESQIGLEPTVEDYVAQMVLVFSEVKRVLMDDGTLWLNLGDSYASPNPGGSQGKSGQRASRTFTMERMEARGDCLPAKNLIGIPWRVAFALQADGWYLRQDIIWSKPNPMPESVTDRCTKSHEYIFLLSKSPRYFYDAAAIAEPITESSIARLSQPNIDNQAGSGRVPGKTNGTMKAVGARPQRVRAEELARRGGLTDEHIAAIRSAGITDTGKARLTQNGTGRNAAQVELLANEAKQVLGGYYREFLVPERRNKRDVWEVVTTPYADAHFATFPKKIVEPCILAGSRPSDVVLDPFAGSGTTLQVAKHLGRRAIGIELNADYLPMIERRLQQGVLELELAS